MNGEISKTLVLNRPVKSAQITSMSNQIKNMEFVIKIQYISGARGQDTQIIKTYQEFVDLNRNLVGNFPEIAPLLSKGTSTEMNNKNATLLEVPPISQLGTEWSLLQMYIDVSL